MTVANTAVHSLSMLLVFYICRGRIALRSSGYIYLYLFLFCTLVIDNVDVVVTAVGTPAPPSFDARVIKRRVNCIYTSTFICMQANERGENGKFHPFLPLLFSCSFFALFLLLAFAYYSAERVSRVNQAQTSSTSTSANVHETPKHKHTQHTRTRIQWPSRVRAEYTDMIW